jgi:hypothetical protein
VQRTVKNNLNNFFFFFWGRKMSLGGCEIFTGLAGTPYSAGYTFVGFSSSQLKQYQLAQKHLVLGVSKTECHAVN